ncbi:flavin-containing monooxygenase [Acinetobacter sp. SWAC57]|uniref:flavin-containing monooxygenase n=1 Tax=Acinetobacter sp. SWAC57 TaxID=2293834 RepID=UPI000E5C358E|nr:NAD(P)/FAD-dependent oxidoreductase [Acinetobacter sp. SWAC57]RGD92092.1 NAD(P)/FAD-dependent oxidoreductase [Acinetobacter sp. SWAC57]
MQAANSSLNTPHARIAIIGAGFGGLAMAIRLLESNIQDFIILEKASEIGGTWRENQYPGAACDVQSHLYSLSFSPKTDWSKRYAEAPEIYQYMQTLTTQHQLQSYIRFNTEVSSARYLENKCIWELKLNQTEILTAQFVIFASGPLHVPQIPYIAGIEKFTGKVFHSSQWDHNYDLNNKNVASIGTGGSAIQYIPEIAEKVKQLYVLQRTAAWVIPRDERRYLPLEKTLFKRFDWFRKIHRARLYWTNESRVVPIMKPQVMKYAQKLAEAYIRHQVKDSATAEKLVPNYIMGCKRILVSNKYYPSFNRKNVELVTDDILELTEDSIITQDGKKRAIDCLIYGTGFVTNPRIYLKSFSCTGLNHVELTEAWKNGAESYYGISTKGFPNLFQLLGPNTVLGHNSVIFMIESQVNYILQLIEMTQKTQSQAIVVKADTQDQFNQHLQSQFTNTIWQSGCVSWYQQEDGKNFSLWPTYTWKYWLKTRKVNPADYRFLNSKQDSQAIN